MRFRRGAGSGVAMELFRIEMSVNSEVEILCAVEGKRLFGFGGRFNANVDLACAKPLQFLGNVDLCHTHLILYVKCINLYYTPISSIF